jgi:hypothetical protein
MATPAERFNAGIDQRPARPREATAERGGSDWVSRRVSTNGVVTVSWQQVCIGTVHAGEQGVSDLLCKRLAVTLALVA